MISKELASLLKEATEAARKEEEAEAKEAAAVAAKAEAEAKGEDATGDDEKEEASAEASKDEVVAEEKSEDAKPDDVKVEKETYQKTVTLRSEMDSVASQGIYQDYLMFCMQGDTVTAPMGVQITIERDQSEFTRLAQLGDILGLNQMEVGTVHKGLADKAFRAQAEQLLGDGKGLTAERSEKLKEIQQSLQLPEPDAQRIIKGITSKKVRVALTKSVNTLFAHTRPAKGALPLP